MYTSTSQEASSNVENMSVEVFNPQERLSLINSWLRQYDLSPVEAWQVPQTAFMLKEDEKDIASVFLYATDSGICWLEGVIVNPLFKGKLQKHFHYARVFIEETAQQMGFKQIQIRTHIHKRQFESAGYTLSKRCNILNKVL